jgi:hypothetical protein
MWCKLTLAMVGEMTIRRCPAPDMLFGQSEASKLMDIFILLLWDIVLGTGAAAATA